MNLSENWTTFKRLFKGLELFHKKFADKPVVGCVNGVLFVDLPEELSEFDIEYLNSFGWIIYETRATFGVIDERTGKT